MHSTTRFRHPLVVAALAVLVAAAYANSFRSGFVLDNQYIIAEDPRVHAATWENVRLIFTQDYWYPRGVGQIFRPITTLSFLFDYAILGWDQKPAGFHWINLGLHFLNASLVYFLMLRLLGKMWPAIAAAAIFAVHPIGVESVTNIVGRGDLLATATVLGGILIYIRAVSHSGWQRWFWLLVLAGVTALGLLCKESAIVIVGLLPLYDFAYRYRWTQPSLLRELWAIFKEYFLNGYAILVPLVVGLFTLRHFMYVAYGTSPLALQDNLLRGGDFLAARLTAIKVIGYYLWLLIFPVHLSCDYSYNQVPLFSGNLSTFEDWKVPIACIVVLGLLMLAAISLRRNRALFFLIAFFFFTMLPTSNLILLIDSNMAERFLYLPMVGFAGCAGIALSAIRRPGNSSTTTANVGTWRWTVLAVLIGLGTIRTFVRNRDWESNLTLYSHDSKVVPNSVRIYRQLAFAIFTMQSRDHLDEAIAAADHATRLAETMPQDDSDVLAFLYLGMFHGEKGLDQNKAAHSTDAGLDSFSRSVVALEKARAIDDAQAAKAYLRARARGKKPGEIPETGVYQIYQNLGASYSSLGRHREAMLAFQKMVRRNPSDQQLGQYLFGYRALAGQQIALGQLEDAAVSLILSRLVGEGNELEMADLDRIYQRLNNTNVPAVVTSNGIKQLNPYCSIVNDHLTTACVQLADAFIRIQNYPSAENVRAVAWQMRCNMRRIDSLWEVYGLNPDSSTK